MATNPVNGQGVLDQTGLSGISSNGAGSLQNEFLTMMVAEIQNQDPLNPIDGSQYVGQLAQLSTVSSLENLRIQQQQSAVQMNTLQVLQSTQLVGQTVMVPGKSVQLGDSGDLSGQVTLAKAADSVGLKVYNANGDVVAERSWGKSAAGTLDFSLNDLPAGKYTFEATSTLNGAVTRQDTALARPVTSVSIPGDGDIQLEVAGIGRVSLYAVTRFSSSNVN